MEKQGRTTGITLIALIITIIILLILAGITIATLTGEDGLLDKTKIASQKNKYAIAEEKVKLAVMASVGANGNLDDDLLKDNVNEIDGLEKKITEVNYDVRIKVDGYEFKISKLGKVTGTGVEIGNNKLPQNTPTTEAGTEVELEEKWKTETMRIIKTKDGSEEKNVRKVATVYAVSAGGGESVPVPNGFYYVGGTINSGVVISDNTDDKNKYAGKEDVGKDLQGNQFVWIPCSIENYQKYDWGDKYNINLYDSRTNTGEEIQIQKYGGFYVGRYEAGTSEVTLKTGKKIGDEQTTLADNDIYTVDKITENSKPTTKANEIPHYYVNTITAEEMSKRMYNTDSVSSGLITGTQWDVMLNFMSNESNKSVTNTLDENKYLDLKSNCTWGNFNDTTLNNCEGRYCLIDSNGSVISNWENNITKTNNNNVNFTLLTTGATEEVKKKNLYDVAGNLWESTQETVVKNDVLGEVKLMMSCRGRCL